MKVFEIQMRDGLKQYAAGDEYRIAQRQLIFYALSQPGDSFPLKEVASVYEVGRTPEAAILGRKSPRREILSLWNG